METCFLFWRKNCTHARFKSYYVVWKPYEVTSANDGRFQFKSYYVVWKHLLLLVFSTAYFVFKSYYVVWKLSSAIQSHEATENV